MPEEKTPVKKKIAKGKTWYKIHAPKLFNEKEIGEAIGFDEASVIGRVIALPLSEVTGDITKHYIKLSFKVTDVKGQDAYTEIVEYSIAKQYLSRMLRRRASKIEIVNDITLKEDKPCRIKSVIITAYKADANQKSAIYQAARTEMEKRAVQFDLPNIVAAFSTGKIQKEIGEVVRKIFPLKIVEVRKIELLKVKKEESKPEEPKVQ